MKKIKDICREQATAVAKKVINRCFSNLMEKSEKGTYPFDKEPEAAAQKFIDDMSYEIKHDSSNMFFNDSSARAIMIEGGWSRPEQVLADYTRICSKISKNWVDVLKSAEPKKRNRKPKVAAEK